MELRHDKPSLAKHVVIVQCRYNERQEQVVSPILNGECITNDRTLAVKNDCEAVSA